MEHKNALGEAVRLVRSQKGLPQEGVGASQSYISDVERGEKTPSLEKIQMIAAAVNVHPLSILAASFLIEDPELGLKKLMDRVREEVNALLDFREGR